MCKCCQRCFESCYWHLIEERFCFDESIASYQEPITKEEKNNNFDNMAFYDSVSVIAGRAIVTIDPLPPKKNQDIIVNQQPRRLINQLKKKESIKTKKSSDVPDGKVADVAKEETVKNDEIIEDKAKEEKSDEEVEKAKPTVKKTVSFHNIINKFEEQAGTSRESLSSPESPVETRRKPLRERRMSKSLSLKLSLSQELPIIRQNSVPKFFLDSPDEHYTESTLVKGPLTALQSAQVATKGFTFNLKSVVQMETERQQQEKEIPTVHRVASKISLKDRMKLRKSKSTVSASNLPHINYI